MRESHDLSVRVRAEPGMFDHGGYAVNLGVKNQPPEHDSASERASERTPSFSVLDRTRMPSLAAASTDAEMSVGTFGARVDERRSIARLGWDRAFRTGGASEQTRPDEAWARGSLPPQQPAALSLRYLSIW